MAAGLEYLHIHRPPLCCSNLNPVISFSSTSLHNFAKFDQFRLQLGILIDNNLNAVLGACASFELYYDEGDPFEDHRFTSPEVLSEGSEARNTLSDVWSWGCCVYEAREFRRTAATCLQFAYIPFLLDPNWQAAF